VLLYEILIIKLTDKSKARKQEGITEEDTRKKAGSRD
jgi:hypothetical protein